MYFSAGRETFGMGLRRVLNLGLEKSRRTMASPSLTGATILETRVLPAAAPVGTPVDIDPAAAIAMDPQGNFVVTWTESTADENQSRIEADIMARMYFADGTPAGDAFLVNTTTENFQTQPTIAMNASGEFIIGWSSQVATYEYVEFRAQRFDAAGVAVGEEFRVDDTEGRSVFGTLNVVLRDDGSFVFAWDRSKFTNQSDVFIRRYDSTGAPLENEVLVVENVIFSARPDIALLPDGGFVMAFADDVSLMGRRFDAAGQAVGNWIDIGTGELPSIAVDATGDFVIAWSQYENNWSTQRAYARRFSSEAVANGDPFALSTAPAQQEMRSSVAVSAEGHFVVTWTITNPNFLARDVFARTYNADGVPVGEEFRVNPEVEGDQWWSNIAMTPTGEFLITWFDDSAGREVYAQRYLLNLAPTDIALSSDAVLENSSVGTVVGTLTGVDADGDDSFVYELVSGPGDDDNAAFEIVDNELRTAAVFDYESKTSATIRVRATDLTGASIEKVLTIQITNVAETQVVTLDGHSIAENLPKGTLVGNLGLTDAAEGSIRYRLVGGEGADGNGKFRISGNRLLTDSKFNFEKQSSYTVRVEARDAAGNVTVQVFTIAINDVAEAPTAIMLSKTTVAGNKRPGTIVGRLSAIDPNPGDRFQFTLVEGAVDNALFKIRGNTLRTRVRFDSGVQLSYTVRIRVTDGEGHSFEEDFAISIV